jgi:hypothetical protein
VAGMISALILLNWARRHYDEDYQRQSALGTFKLDLD